MINEAYGAQIKVLLKRISELEERVRNVETTLSKNTISIYNNVIREALGTRY